MAKVDFAIHSSLYYRNEEYIVIRPITPNTIKIRSVKDKNIVIDVSTQELTSHPEPITTNLDQFSEKEWSQAQERYKIIEDLVFRQRSRIEVEEQAKKYGIGTNTLYTWIRTYESTKEFTSLIPKKRGKRGSRLAPELDEVIGHILELHYLSKQRTGFKKIYRLIKQECNKRNLLPPHENTVRNRIKSIDPKLSMKRREGYKKAHQHFSNFEGTFPEGNYPLEVMQIDHTPLDIIVVDETHREPIGRPTLTLAFDVYSRMISGFYLSLQAPGYFNVSQCFYNALLPKERFLQEEGIEGEWIIFGVPRVVHVDNGQDLVSNDMVRVCDDLSMLHMKRPVANPQFGAHVERVFGTINKEIHNLQGTTFSNVQEKGEYDSRRTASFTLGELRKWLTQYIVNVYHKSHHRGINDTPENMYYKGIFGDENTAGTGILPSRVENEESIKILLLQTFYRTVQKDGITLDGISYYSDVLRSWINKKDKQGNKLKFKIKRDPLDIQKIYFYDPEIKEYFEVYYRVLTAPQMTLWDLKAAKRYLKKKDIIHYKEEDIFAAYDVLTKIEESAKEKTKKQKLRKNKSIKMTDIQKRSQQENSPKEHEHFEDLFKNIETFEIHEKSQEESY